MYCTGDNKNILQTFIPYSFYKSNSILIKNVLYELEPFIKKKFIFCRTAYTWSFVFFTNISYIFLSAYKSKSNTVKTTDVQQDLKYEENCARQISINQSYNYYYYYYWYARSRPVELSFTRGTKYYTIIINHYTEIILKFSSFHYRTVIYLA